MDQLKNILAVVKKYHFWILCGLAVAMGMTVWSLATADLASRIESRQKTIKGKRDEMTRIIQQDAHPNQRVVEALKKQHAALKAEALAAWKSLYDQQQADNQLPDILSEGFKTAFQQLSGPEDQLDRRYLEEYQTFIGQHIPKLLARLNLRPSRQGGGGAGGTATDTPAATETPGEKPQGIVIWEGSGSLRSRFYFRGSPTTEQVLQAQEDLWVYEALIRVITNTNGNARYHEEAPIREIQELSIGEDVDYASLDSKDAMLSGGKPAARREQNSSRYVDDAGLPLPGPPYKHPYAEFKMMPIRMKVLIQQTKIPKLLAECANSTMPIEVRRWQLRPGEGESINLTQLVEASADSGTSRGGTAGPPAVREINESADDYVPIQIDGIICIYNRPPAETNSETETTARIQTGRTAAPGAS